MAQGGEEGSGRKVALITGITGQLCSVFMAAIKSILWLATGDESPGEAAPITGVDSRTSGGNPIPCV